MLLGQGESFVDSGTWIGKKISVFERGCSCLDELDGTASSDGALPVELDRVFQKATADPASTVPSSASIPWRMSTILTLSPLGFTLKARLQPPTD